MEFTTAISEQDFIAAYGLRCKSSFRTVINAFIYVLVFVLLFLHASAFTSEHTHPGDATAARNASLVEQDIFPLEVACLFYILGFKVYLPYRMRCIYRKDLNHKGEMAVQLSPEGISERSSTGSKVYFPWNTLAQWREAKRVIVIMAQSGLYFIFPKACLTADQLGEIRSILLSTLQKK
jgi:hypothetical protein